jgi:protocatechuate 3,4-dioxygenase beta subunit
MARYIHALAILLFLQLIGGGLRLSAQGIAVNTTSVEGTITGRVVDAESTLPLAGARVVLEPLAPGALPAGAGEGAFLSGARVMLTDTAGEYRFGGIPTGTYRLRVERIGYHGATLELRSGGVRGSRVSVGLTVEAVALAPLEVRGKAAPPYARSAATAAEVAARRHAAERLRQRRHLVGDTRAVTHADVIEAVTFGETDLFRALQRLPGVSTRDDLAAELWVRGAPWNQTQLWFDGLPLWNPLHALGAFSGVSTDAIGAAFLHPGVQPVSLGGAAAGVLEVESRRGGEGRINGTGELSLASARLALDGEARDGNTRWMIAGRRSHLDLLTTAAASLAGNDEIRIPYNFSDLVGRYDRELGEHRRIETSVFSEFDRVTGTIPDILHHTAATWGGGGGRLSYITTRGRLESRHTVGVSGFSSSVRDAPRDSAREAGYTAPAGATTRNNLYYWTLRGEWAPLGSGAGTPRWSAGYEGIWYDQSYLGPEPMTYRGPSSSERWPGGEVPFSISTQLRLAALWGERRWTPSEQLSVQAGARVEGGEAVNGGGPLRIGPRLSARYRLRPDIALSAGYGRSFQYVQTIGAVGAEAFGPVFAIGHLRLLAGGEVPVLRSDITTLGAEWWLGGGWLATANAYVRRSNGVAVPDPTPGEAVDRPLFVEGTTAARGVELAARRIAGRWTFSAGYALSTSETEAAGLRFASEQDRRHTLDVTTMARLSDSWRLGAAFSAASGSPYTRFFTGWQTCDEVGRCSWNTPPRLEAPNAERMPAYASVDLLADWSRRFRGWELGAYLQLRNALNRENPGAYLKSQDDFGPRSDEFVPGLPMLPLFGFRAAF